MNSIQDIIFVYSIVFFIVAFFFIIQTRLQFSDKIEYSLGFLFCVVCAIYFGFREYSVGVDTYRYVKLFQSLNIQAGLGFTLSLIENDFGIFIIGYLTKLFTSNPSIFLFIVALIYVSIYSWANYRLLNKNQYLIIVLIVSFFFFYSYGFNGLKSGLAFSFCLLSISFNGYKKYACMGLAFIFHFSSIIFISAWLIANNYTNIKTYIGIWGGAIVLSYLGIGIMNIFGFVGSDFYLHLLKAGDFKQYVSGMNYGYYTGFRYDFILFSGIFLLFPYYYLKKQVDEQYVLITNLYLIMNTLFILSFYLPYSNRVGAFSWILLPYLVGKPLIQSKKFQKIVFPTSLIIFIISWIIMFTV